MRPEPVGEGPRLGFGGSGILSCRTACGGSRARRGDEDVGAGRRVGCLEGRGGGGGVWGAVPGTQTLDLSCGHQEAVCCVRRGRGQWLAGWWGEERGQGKASGRWTGQGWGPTLLPCHGWVPGGEISWALPRAVCSSETGLPGPPPSGSVTAPGERHLGLNSLSPPLQPQRHLPSRERPWSCRELGAWGVLSTGEDARAACVI